MHAILQLPALTSVATATIPPCTIHSLRIAEAFMCAARTAKFRTRHISSNGYSETACTRKLLTFHTAATSSLPLMLIDAASEEFAHCSINPLGVCAVTCAAPAEWMQTKVYKTET